MAIGGAIVVAGGVALLVKALRERAKRLALTPHAGAAGAAGFKPTVDLALTSVAPITSSQVRTGTLATKKLLASAMVVGTVLSVIGNVLGSLINLALANPYMWIAVAVVLIVMGIIFFEFGADNAQRIKYAIRGMYGSRFTLNRWEFGSTTAWLDQLKIPYKVQSIKDDWIRTDVYDTETNTKFWRYEARYAITDVGLPKQTWDELQFFVRTAAIDYFLRVPKYLDGTYTNVKRAIGDELPPRMPSLPRSAYLPARNPTFTAASPIKNDPTYGFAEAWSGTPLIGDVTSYDLKATDPKTGGSVIPLDKPGYGARTGASFASSFEAAVAKFAGQPAWLQVQLNNHFTAICSALAIFKLDLRDVKSGEWNGYTYHMWMGAWLSENDHVRIDGSLLHFDKDYWGWEIVLDTRRFKLGESGAFKVVSQDGRIIDLSFDTPRA